MSNTRKEIVICDNENSFKVLFCQNPVPMWIVDIETLHFLAVNNACIKHYGYSRNEFLEGSLLMLRPPAEHETAKQLIIRIRNKQTISKNITHLKKDGTAIAVQITSYTVNFHNRICRMVTIQDVTLQKLRDNKLKEAWHRLRQTLDSVTDGFLTLDKELTITYLNKEAGRILEVSKGAALNHHLYTAIPQLKNTNFLKYLYTAISDGRKTKFEEYLPILDKWICSTVYPTDSGIAVYFTDITRERKAQQIINNYDKRFQELAYFHSHQIRKEVANILGILNLLENEIGHSKSYSTLLAMLNVCAIKLDQTIVNVNSDIEN